MATHPLQSGSAVPPADWHSSHGYTSNQMVSLIRAVAIALVLLGVLVAIVLL